MKTLPYALLCALGGAIVPIQIGIISAFRHSSNASQIQATVYLYAGGLLTSVLLTYLLGDKILPPHWQKTQWWMWSMGFIGAFYLLFMFIAAPKIGAANTLVWVFLGQIFFAAALDKIGWLNMPAQALNPLKIIGLLLIFSGGVLMLFSNRSA
ncbi:DMT family transporter [Stenoxybacter acetivorans]|uniref:DMT family transporter n=1 Tax=Stenoxybacter acetivorans TaxID=422441 RepID=UPI00055AD1A9|nr:DMT family transporter [Stenoxybacter acetivorans]